VARADYSLEREIEQATARLYPSGYGFQEEVGIEGEREPL
jgi:hypothetical protein